MLPRVAIWTHGPFLGDALFDPASPLNRDDCLASMRILRHRLEAGGGRCHTFDVFVAEGTVPDAVLFFDIPAPPAARVLPAAWGGLPRWVALIESEVVLPRNWDATRHAEFDVVLTWRHPLVDGDRYLPLTFPNPIRPPRPVEPGSRRTLATMIAGHKRSRHPKELYSERLATIRWFERHHPDDFDLYGVGWDRRSVRLPGLPELPVPTRLTDRFPPPRPSYRGPTRSKAETLRRYRFAVCYENARSIPGYITEKLFDCLLAPIVPIYWGADEIGRHVPEEAFVDRRAFASHEQLYDHLTTMSEADYARRLEAGQAFLAGPAAAAFSNEAYVDALMRPMVGSAAARAAGGA